jgi:DNA-binding NtrC family response regulator
LSKRKVLLVDDERDFVEALGERMRSRGLKISTAFSATDAIKMTEKEDYDVVVLDLSMPEMNGLEVLRMLKEHNPNLHVIFLTGHATVEKGILAMMSGAAEIIEKPSDVETLVRKIEKVTGKKMVDVESGQGVGPDRNMTH